MQAASRKEQLREGSDVCASRFSTSKINKMFFCYLLPLDFNQKSLIQGSKLLAAGGFEEWAMLWSTTTCEFQQKVKGTPNCCN